MKYGAIFPQTEIGPDPAVVREFIQTVESMGFDYLLAYDHVVGANPDRPGGWRGPYTHQSAFHEVFVLFAYAAALTTTLELVTGILVLPQRQAALVAKQAAEIDLLSGGRLRLGVGVGWNTVEMSALGERFDNRGRRVDEQVRVMQHLWTEELVTFDGEFHQLDDVGINPMPVQQPIPVWFGGGADPVLRRMARLGAGWMPSGMPVERAKPMVAQIHEYLRAEGRDPAQFGIDVRVNPVRSSTEEWQAELAEWRELGATHVAANTMGAGFTRLDQHLATLETFLQDVRS